MNSTRGQRGYSLAEMLTVVAIVGTLTLVTVPAFMTYRQSAKMKTSMRNLTTDLRTARSLAISRAHQVKLSFRTGTKARVYNYYEGNKAVGTVDPADWRPLTGANSTPPKPQREMDPIVYFPPDGASTPQTFVDEDNDGTIDVIFYPDGTVKLPAGSTKGTISIKTDMRIFKPQYAVEISPTGRVLAR